MATCECRGLYRENGTTCNLEKPATWVAACEHVVCEDCALIVSRFACCACGVPLTIRNHFRPLVDTEAA